MAPNSDLLVLPLAEYIGETGWGLEQGRTAFQKLDRAVRESSARVIKLDLRNVKRLDVSCAREALALLVRHHHGGLVFFASGAANESVLENIDAAFARLELSLLYRPRAGEYRVLGVPLKPHLKTTLDVVEQAHVTTAREVTDKIRDLSLTACNNRLRDLAEAGLILRSDGSSASGGKEYCYAALR